jgi:hypothetical protein
VTRGERARALLVAALVSVVTLAVSARGDDDKPSGDKDSSDQKADTSDQKPAGKSNLVGRVSTEVSFYKDTEAVTVLTPTIGASLENPLSEWSISGRYLVDVVSAASVDIVATASRAWHEVRHEGSFDGSFKAGPVSIAASGGVSREGDTLNWAVGGNLGLDLAQKNVTLLLGYAFNHDTYGITGTPFSVFSNNVIGHTVNGAITVLVNRDTILSAVGDVIVESGDSSKVYRYVPMFAPNVANTIPVGASIDTVNAERLDLKPREQLPLSRDRFALTGRVAHRFSSSTLRVSERFYRDTWGLTASSTDVKYIFDVGERVSMWPHARLHLQAPVSFWQRTYTATQNASGAWVVPAIRTGDRELGPLRGLTGGFGLQIKIGPSASPADLTLTLQGETIWTSYLDDLYISNRVSGLGVLVLEAVIE